MCAGLRDHSHLGVVSDFAHLSGISLVLVSDRPETWFDECAGEDGGDSDGHQAGTGPQGGRLLVLPLALVFIVPFNLF